MTSSARSTISAIPAQLAYLTIYNPSLARTDEQLEDQVVYYTSKRSRSRRKHRRNTGLDDVGDGDRKDEKLRQIGLAQGMVEFAKGFANGQPVDSIETEKSRIVLHELERGWWILASVDLTRLPLSSNAGSTSHQTKEDEELQKYEYSAREVSPPLLLIHQLLKAHSIFLLHHGRSLEEIYERLGRIKFCRALDQFWTQFTRTWDVLLHGNPCVQIFQGIKLAAGGELGIGVGEEEWGSGEREVLEGLIQTTDGLRDMIVARFGDPRSGGNRALGAHSLKREGTAEDSLNGGVPDSWPSPADGVIFSGIGAITNESIRAVAGWMEWLHVFGDKAYGVRDYPGSSSRRKQRDYQKRTASNRPNSRNRAAVKINDDSSLRVKASSSLSMQGLGDNHVPINRQDRSVAFASIEASPSNFRSIPSSAQEGMKDKTVADRSSPIFLPDASSASSSASLMRYLKLGYGSSWGVPSKLAAQSMLKEDSGRQNQDHPPHDNSTTGPGQSRTDTDETESKSGLHKNPSTGYFLVGLQGDLNEDEGSDLESRKSGSDQESAFGEQQGRIHLRTVHVFPAKRDSSKSNSSEVERESLADEANSSSEALSHRTDTAPATSSQQLRVVVYKDPPFLYIFLFDLQTPTLAISAFYRSLHHQLGQLQRPLLASTSPDKVVERIMTSGSLYAKAAKTTGPLYDLVFDPDSLAIHSTIPNIPEPSSLTITTLGSSARTALQQQQLWSRIEALNVHTQILSTFASSRHHPAELEHTCKTSRGWWVVWMRMPLASELINRETDGQKQQYREAFLVRKASDYVSRAAQRNVSGTSTASTGWAPGKLAEGIGIDARKYIEGLWSLNR